MRTRSWFAGMLLWIVLASATIQTTRLVAQGEDAQAASYTIEFAAGSRDSKFAPAYSPKGTQVPLAVKAMPGLEGVDHLEGRLKLGPPRQNGSGQLLVLARSQAGKPYDLLFLDAGHDGSVLDDKPQTTTPSINRGSHWSSFTATLRVNHAAAGEPAAWEEYPVNFWAVVEKEADPEMIRFSRRGFLTGSANLAGIASHIVLSDSDNDAVFGPQDWWTISTQEADRPIKSPQPRAVNDYCWAGGKAWKLELRGTNGRQGRIIPYDPGLTEEEDLIRRDKLREDRLAPRAVKPVPFRADVDEAIGQAVRGKKPHFLYFEADWCIPCKQMHELVFTAKAVADATGSLVCITIDSDERKDLVEKHAVKGYPHGILFGPDGKELARFSGYQSVKETAAFIGKLQEKRDPSAPR